MEERVNKKVIIDPYRGGDDTGNVINNITEKNYNLNLSKYIYNRLRELGIPTTLTRNSDETIDIDSRTNLIKSIYGTGNDIIVISNALTTGGEGAEIVYALRNSSGLSEKLSNELTKVGLNISKYYQRRLPSNTSKDYYQLIRDTSNNESIIIFYGNIDNSEEAKFLQENLENIGEAVVIAIANYLGINYVPTANDNYYIVKKGDTLYSIAKKYNTTINELQKLNNLTNNNLKTNQILKIPTQTKNELLDNKTTTYIVVSGDSLYSIAKKYNTSINELKELNNLTSNLLSIGQTLKIPSKEETNNDYITYTIKKGDTLYKLASTYKTTVNEIKSLNNLTSNNLSIGQIIKIPNNDNNINYVVTKGDTLYSIAKKYNTTISKIKELNNLTSNLLSIGQTLKIPV